MTRAFSGEREARISRPGWSSRAGFLQRLLIQAGIAGGNGGFEPFAVPVVNPLFAGEFPAGEFPAEPFAREGEQHDTERHHEKKEEEQHGSGGKRAARGELRFRRQPEFRGQQFADRRFALLRGHRSFTARRRRQLEFRNQFFTHHTGLLYNLQEMGTLFKTGAGGRGIFPLKSFPPGC